MSDHEHCDDYVEDIFQPKCLRWFIFINRLPAGIKALADEKCEAPKLWAKYRNVWHRVVMASRMGDVGITKGLDADYGYTNRVNVSDLTDFTDEHPNRSEQRAERRRNAKEQRRRTKERRKPPSLKRD